MEKTIVFIHGMFQNPKSWKKWVNYYENKGYNCVAPAWPDHEGEPEQLRKNPPDSFGDLTLDDVISKMEKTVIKHGGNSAEPDQKPIVIGHSVGGLVGQIFANRDLISLGVFISPVAPNKMMTPDWPFLKNVASIANPLEGDEPYQQTLESFHENFCNTLNDSEAKQAFEETATPGSRNVLRGCLGSSGEVDLDKPHVPLLFITGEEDKIIATELVEKNYNAFKDAQVNKHVDFKRFPGRSHYICNEPGWEEVANYTHDWLEMKQVNISETIH